MGYSKLGLKSQIKKIDGIFKNIVLTIISLFAISLCIYIFNYFTSNNQYTIIEGVTNKDDTSTPWTKLPVNKQVEKLLNEANTITEHALNSSQGDPEKVDYDKLIYIQNLKKSLREIDSSTTETYANLNIDIDKYNPFSGKEDNESKKNEKSSNKDEPKTSKLFW